MRARRAPGEGTIVARPNGTWQGQLDLGVDPETGRRLRKTATGATKKEVAEKLKKIREAAEKGMVAKPRSGTLTVRDALEAHAARLDARMALGEVKPSTRAWWGRMMAHAAPLAEARLGKLTQRDVERWLAGIEGSPSLRRGAYLALQNTFETARRNGMMSRDPFAGLTAPSGEREAEPVHATRTDVEELLSLAEPPWRQLFAVLAFTGLRRGEVLALRWDDVDLDARVLRVREGKTDRARRTVPLIELVVDQLRELGPGTGLVFPGPTGEQLNPRTVNRAFERYSPREGLTPHGLRHGAATRMLEQGVSVHVVSALLGHSSTTITLDTYSHSVGEMERGALAALE